MNSLSKKTSLSGSISVPGSKSHTIRACLLAALAEGVSYVRNPLPSADCLSAARCIKELGAKVEMSDDNSVWTITGAGKNVHLPSNVVDVGNSGSVLYFLTPIASTFSGWSIFTGDESIRTRPVSHLADALVQLGAETHISRPDVDAPPFLVKGPIKPGKVVTDGRLSQYISGIMMAATQMDGVTEIELTDPKEVPYLDMTKYWLESLGVQVEMSSDYKKISVTGPYQLKAFDKAIPSDWEAVAFPLIAALISDSKIVIDNVDGSGTQGDDAIVSVLQSVGADIQWNKETSQLFVTGGNRLSTENLADKTLRVNLAGFPDAICALAVIACFIEGKTVLEDIGVCRRKETDRIKVMKSELEKLGAKVEEGEDFIAIYGHSPILADGSENPEFTLHGGNVESYDDHRVAMSLACLGLGLKDGENVIVNDAECCSVSFPGFFEVMNKI
ncbi:MAG: 3-phosphoshikimate 1-carboxyvinyltransferase, partial [Spirochaetaceae bacterium]|nr:3-phosphoshikimate 1-carboxyvinyltransferase [Spirochaetaceae bacterium]